MPKSKETELRERVRKMFDHQFGNNPVFRISPLYRNKIKDFIDTIIDLALDEKVKEVEKLPYFVRTGLVKEEEVIKILKS